MATSVKTIFFIFLILSFFTRGIVLCVCYPVCAVLSPYFNNNVLSCVARLFVPFDGAKVRRFSDLTKAFGELCAQTLLFLTHIKESQEGAFLSEKERKMAFFFAFWPLICTFVA
jgi:hypothetical protein